MDAGPRCPHQREGFTERCNRIACLLPDNEILFLQSRFFFSSLHSAGSWSNRSTIWKLFLIFSLNSHTLFILIVLESSYFLHHNWDFHNFSIRRLSHSHLSVTWQSYLVFSHYSFLRSHNSSRLPDHLFSLNSLEFVKIFLIMRCPEVHNIPSISHQNQIDKLSSLLQATTPQNHISFYTAISHTLALALKQQLMHWMSSCQVFQDRFPSIKLKLELGSRLVSPFVLHICHNHKTHKQYHMCLVRVLCIRVNL